jgi:protein tyrosine phosphatase (PTP) superfamily phosphohydrolase (DUF442 family)
MNPLRRWRSLWRELAVLVALVGAPLPAAVAATLDAPNMVPISATLVTAGQPKREALGELSKLGFEAVIYLVPSNVSGAVKDEPEIVRAQGLEFIHIPIPFGAPAEAHYTELAAALNRLKGKRVLVHCEVNLRASTLVFLYRVIALKEDVGKAYDDVARVWSPRGPWKSLATSMLRKHGVEFELY